MIHQPDDTNLLDNLLKLAARIPDGMLDSKNNFGQTPLHLAVIQKKYHIIAKLLAAGANPNESDRYGNTALHVACRFSDTRSLDVLLKNSKCMDLDKLNADGFAALHMATRKNDCDFVKQLLAAGANVNVRAGCTGRTPLHLAVLEGNLAVLKILSEDVNRL